MDSLFSLKGKVALVTGGSRGIGRMITEGLLRYGARVYITSRDGTGCGQAARELSSLGEVCAIAGDLASYSEIGRIAGFLSKKECALHILICNAGTVWNAPFADFPENGWDKVQQLNVRSPFFTTQAFMPMLRLAASSDDPARVINVTSIDAFHVPLTETYSYSAAKAGLTMVTRMLAKRLGPEHITVNAIAPGVFATKMTAGALEYDKNAFLQQVPLGRLGRGDDMAGAAVFLASRAGAYVSGTTLVVDGGWLGAT